MFGPFVKKGSPCVVSLRIFQNLSKQFFYRLLTTASDESLEVRHKNNANDLLLHNNKFLQFSGQ